ncbi:MAG: hypothetical protein JWO31_3192 [Phycisphaerales bacterium]|nr:hypothetical protein [Phycisphaerales bacterium]
MAALVVAVAAAGCRKSVDARTATPRAAAKAFATAMSTGDAEVIGQVSTGDDASLRVLAASAALNAAYAKLERAAADRFGDPKAVISVGRGSDHYAKMLTDLDAAPEAVKDDQASVGTGMRKIYLKKVGTAWRVDRSMHVPPGDVDAHVAMVRAMTNAYDGVRAGLAAGAYESADAAKAAFMGKTMEAVMSVSPPPATAPAATPPAVATAPASRPGLPAATTGPTP